MYAKEDLARFEEAYRKMYPCREDSCEVFFKKMDGDEFCYELWEVHELFCFFLAGSGYDARKRRIEKCLD